MKMNSLFGKTVVFGIILMVICVGYNSTAKNIKNDNVFLDMDSNHINSGFNGNTLFVGGTEPGNYSKIQDAIDNASDGDTVFVYDDSSPYYEIIMINKSVNLIGEDKNSIIIDGQRIDDVVMVMADYVSISGFTIQKGRLTPPFVHSGIYLDGCNNCTINDNIMSDNNVGINFYMSDKNTIYNNLIIDNYGNGLDFVRSHNNSIIMNEIHENDNGIYLQQCESTEIVGNSIINQRYKGIYLSESSKGVIVNNTIQGCEKGILVFWKSSYNHIGNNDIRDIEHSTGVSIEGYSDFNMVCNNKIANCIRYGVKIICSEFNTIRQNDFINNTINDIYLIVESNNNKITQNNFEENIFKLFFKNCENNSWEGNYWGRPRISPKLLFGFRDLNRIKLPVFAFDLRPALSPIDC